MELNTPFKIRDLPDNSWSVSWPGYEYVLVNNIVKAQNLLEILFDKLKINEVELALRREGWSEDKTEIMHVNVSAWWQDKVGLAKYLTDFIVVGIKFRDLAKAEQFKDIMDKRLMWSRLSGGKKWK